VHLTVQFFRSVKAWRFSGEGLRIPRSWNYLGGDRKSETREREGSFVKQERQGFDLAVNPLSDQLQLFERVSAVFLLEQPSTFAPKRLPWLFLQGSTCRDSPEWNQECTQRQRTLVAES
jgi:hypothetical protein